jgi:hypothetical protein
MHRITPAAVAALALAQFAVAQAPPPGSRAILNGFSHNVSGVVTVVDEDTLRVEHFTYDGGGVQVFFNIAPIDNHSSFLNDGLYIGSNLLGMVYDDGSITIDLPAGRTLDGYGAISVWCIPFRANFGSGAFLPLRLRRRWLCHGHRLRPLRPGVRGRRPARRLRPRRFHHRHRFRSLCSSL